MNILVVNDDGVDSPGIVMLAQAARKFGEVTVVAPDGQRSGMSQHITVHGDIVAERAKNFPLPDVPAWKISGTPADCVRIGIWYAMEKKPDLLLSGINSGFNCGLDIVYSGTVGAAKEAVFCGIESIAFSVGSFEYLNDTQDYLVPILNQLVHRGIEPDAFWNVNFPKRHKDRIKGILEERFPSSEPYFQTGYYPKAQADEDGMHLEIRMTYPEQLEKGSDIQALLDGYISIGKVGHLTPAVP